MLCFTLYFEGKFQVQATRGAYIWRGHLPGVFCVTILGGLYLEGLYMKGLIFGILRELYFYLSIVTLKCNVNNEIKAAMDNLKQKFDAH